MNLNPPSFGEALAKASTKFFKGLSWILTSEAGFIRDTSDVGSLA